MTQIGLGMFEIQESRKISEDLHFKRMIERDLWQNNRIFISIDTYLSENILRAFQFVQEDNVHVDHVMDVMRLRERSQSIASSEGAYARSGEVHRYVLAAVLAEHFQSHRQQLALLRTTEF